MRGTGRTVFSGDKIDNFDVEILGILENIGPKQSLILGRLSGGPLEKTGVMQGMSGSPVYVDGKLVGAVAMAFPFSKEPIAGIRPIHEMLQVSRQPSPKPVRVALTDTDLTKTLPRRGETIAGQMRLVDVATPVSFAGFTRAAIDRFAPQLRALGLEPQQGVAGGGRADLRLGDPRKLEPGSMISVQLMAGDLSIGADGTVTHIDGNNVYAFGHRFLSIGATSLPFARSEVITLLPVLSSSFKISAARELMGVINQDRNTAVVGHLGGTADMVPVSVAVSRGGQKLDSYNMRMVSDRFLSPLLVQMAVFSAIDATERSVGASSFRLDGTIEFQDEAPIKLQNMFAGDAGSAAQVSLSAAVPLAYVLQGGFESLLVKKIELDIESFDEKKQLQIGEVVASRREVRPGEKLTLTALLQGENGVEVAKAIEYRVPESASPGPLYFTVADGATTNVAEFRQVIETTPRSPQQLIETVNRLKANTKAYVRVWRAEPAFQLDGEDLPDPPPSVALVLANSQAGRAGLSQTRNSKLDELEISAGDMVISGSKTIQVEVKE
jgi:hypothetical protein